MSFNSKLAMGVAAVVAATACVSALRAADSNRTATLEYVTIRWDGRDNTQIIRPGGRVEFIAAELRRATKPDRTDDRAFYLNLAMNGLAKEGYEFAGMTPDTILMKREPAP